MSIFLCFFVDFLLFYGYNKIKYNAKAGIFAVKKAVPILSLLIVLIFIVSSCGNPAVPEATNTEAAPVAATTPEQTTEAVETVWEPAKVDLDNYVFRMIMTDNKLWVPMHFSEAETETGQVIEDALLRREFLIEERYNCKIEHIVDSDGPNKVGINVSSGTEIAEVCFFSANKTATLISNGHIADLSKVDGLDLTAPWWDQRINKEYMIGTRIFVTDGEINIRDDLRTMSVIYNKGMYNDYGYNQTYGTPYSLVAEGKWTFDLLMEMIKGKTIDPNDDNGVWGMLSEVSAPYYFFLGAGKKTLVNVDGSFVSNLQDESILNVFEKTVGMAANKDIMIVNNGNHFDNTDVWVRATGLFKQGNVLFRSTTLSAINGMLDMSEEYGILPIPNQGGSNEYYCFASGSNTSPISMPKNVGDFDKAATVIEALAYYSYTNPNPNYITLHAAFYELLSDARLARTADDTRMLDIIFSSKTYDIDQVCAVTGLESAIYSLVKAGNITALSSTINTTRKAADNSVKRFMKAIESKYPN